MKQLECSSLKDSLLSYLSGMTDVSQDGDDCIVTVPINTFDNRWVDVAVEDKGSDFFLVHDSGKAADELFLQGMTFSDTRTGVFHLIANRYGVQFEEGRFIVGCKRDLLQHSVWTIAQCSSLVMSELLRHRPSADEESVKSAVGQILTSWGRNRSVRIEPSFKTNGKIAQHTFDFLATDINSIVAVNVLNPSAGALGRAERYGYQSLDLQGTRAESWKKLAVIANPHVWSAEARRIVNKCASKTVDFVSSKDSQQYIVNTVEEMIKAA
jgi:hypothetical protein